MFEYRESQQLRPEELDLCLQWFANVQDINPQYLTAADGRLAVQICRRLGRRPSNATVELSKRPE